MEENDISHNKIQGTLHVSPDSVGDFNGAGIAIQAIVTGGTVTENKVKNKINMRGVDVDPSDWMLIPGSTASAPALAWNPTASEFQIVVRRSDNTIWTALYNPMTTIGLAPRGKPVVPSLRPAGANIPYQRTNSPTAKAVVLLVLG